MMTFGSTHYLVADIGGTNARFATVTGDGLELQNIKTYSVEKYRSLEQTVDVYLREHNIPLLSGACIAIAGPVSNGEARLTNGAWHIRKEVFCAYFGCEHFLLINDFVAQSMAVPCLTDAELEALDNRHGVNHAPVLVVGPGTGLGAGLLVHTPLGWQPCPGEGGHMNFAPSNEQDLMVWRYLCEQLGRAPCWEDVLSGYGLEYLYRAHLANTGAEDARVAASDITGMALNDSSSLAYSVVQHFMSLLGHYAGNLAVATGALGGVYIAGGIVPRIRTLIDRQSFRKAFEQRGKMQAFMEAIPVNLVLAQQPGLTGSAAYLLQYLSVQH